MIRFAVVLVVLLSSGCQSPQKEQSTSTGRSWSGQMQNMAQDIKLLVPYVYDQKAYSDPQNEVTIQRALQDLASQSHKVPEEMGKKLLGDDPIISYSLDSLQADLNRALYSFSKGQKDYSRSVLKSSMGHCFRCHALTTIGAEARWDVSDFGGLELTAEEKLDLLVAARKYQEAFDFAEEVITRPGIIKKNSMVFENLLRKHLSLSLRLKENPQDTLADLNRVLKNKDLPEYLVKQVNAWRDSLKAGNAPPEGAFIAAAQKRIAKGKELQEFAYDHAGDVEYIWATDILHEGLRSGKAKESEAQAYFLLGLSYEVLSDANAYGLHETYFEACIRKNPRTKLAKRCFERLEASVVQGFSGSAGLSLPVEERRRLDQLKSLL